MRKVLLIEDEPSSAELLQHILQDGGYEVAGAKDDEEGLAAANREDFQAVVTDMKMPRLNGLEVINRLHVVRPQLPVILISGFLTPELAIQAERLGAYGCLVKPPDPAEFLGLLEQAVSQSWPILGSSPAMLDVLKQIGLVAATPMTALIRGEPGTGRALVARVIHRHSRRADQPLVQVDCAGFPEERLNAELFGDPQGTFTDSETRRIGCLRKANHGTLFFHDIGHLGSRAQAQLLGVSHDAVTQGAGGEGVAGVDVHVLAGLDPRHELAIREDLYFRLSEFVIALPPLRDRLEDIHELVTDFMERYAGHGRTSASMIPTPDAMEYLRQQRWPGNVRQLRDVLGKALSLARGGPITRQLLEGLLNESVVEEL